MRPIRLHARIKRKIVPKNERYRLAACPIWSCAWPCTNSYTSSKVCCNLPGRSAESRIRRMAKTTTRMRATRSCMTMESAQGRGWEWMPTSPKMEFANPAKWSLVRRVIQISLSCIRDLEYDRSEEHTSELQSRQYLVCRL